MISRRHVHWSKPILAAVSVGAKCLEPKWLRMMRMNDDDDDGGKERSLVQADRERGNKCIVQAERDGDDHEDDGDGDV